MKNAQLRKSDEMETLLPITDGRVQRKISEIEKKVSAILESHLPNDVKLDLLRHLDAYKKRFFETIYLPDIDIKG